MLNDALIVLCNMFKKKPMLVDKYVKTIMPVLVKYLNWYQETKQLESVISSSDATEEVKHQTESFSSMCNVLL